MKKLIIGFVLLFFGFNVAYAQFDAQLSQYMFNNTYFNPAAAGESDLIQIVGHARLQWLGIPNAGKTFDISVSSPIKIGNQKHGVGLNALSDEIGLFTYKLASMQYAYKRKLGDGVVSVGASLGFASIGFKGDSVKSHNVTIGDFHKLTSDNAIPQTNVVGSSLDMHLGFFYATPVYYAGLSFTHINKPKVLWGDKNEFTLNSVSYLTGGYNYVLANPRYVLKPSFLLKTDFRSMQLDLSSRLEYAEKYWGGLAYRLQDAITVMAGLNISSGMSVGYAYDLPTSKIITVSTGSHELVLLYSFEYVFGKSTSKYKSIRFL